MVLHHVMGRSYVGHSAIGRDDAQKVLGSSIIGRSGAVDKAPRGTGCSDQSHVTRGDGSSRGVVRDSGRCREPVIVRVERNTASPAQKNDFSHQEHSAAKRITNDDVPAASRNCPQEANQLHPFLINLQTRWRRFVLCVLGTPNSRAQSGTDKQALRNSLYPALASPKMWRRAAGPKSPMTRRRLPSRLYDGHRDRMFERKPDERCT